MSTELQRSWHRFLERCEAHRPQLYRYCRYLTRSPWDAEDLAQDTLARAFVTLAKTDQEPQNARAWLFRIASNLWIDQRRRVREAPDAEPTTAMPAPREAREAAGTLLSKLSPQERAAVVLKEAFELSLDEIAAVLGTTEGAVKSALHRGRGKLADDDGEELASSPLPKVLDAFCAAFNAGDLDRLTALLLETATVEVAGATTQYGREAARRTVLTGMLFGSRRLADFHTPLGIDADLRRGALPELPRVEVRLHRGRWILVHWYRHDDGDAVRAFTLVETEGEQIVRLTNHFYDPDFLRDLGGELAVPVRSNGYRWWLP